MKKRNDSNKQGRFLASDRPPAPRGGGDQESAKEFALHLAAMFRSELGEENEYSDPDLNWEQPASETDSREAFPDAGNGGTLYPMEDEDRERIRFFEPKQKRNRFFDSLSEGRIPGESAPAELPAEPPRGKPSRAHTETKRPVRRGGTGANARPDQQKDTLRRRETPSARRVEREDHSGRTATLMRPERGDALRPADSAAQTDPEREPTRVVLRGFSTTPFEPPREDPSLDEIFGPLGLRTAPPDPDDSPTRRGRTPRSAFDLPVDDPIAAPGADPAADEAPASTEAPDDEAPASMETLPAEEPVSGELSAAEELSGAERPTEDDRSAPVGAESSDGPTEAAAPADATAPREEVQRSAPIPEETSGVSGKSEEISTEEAILEVLRLLGDLPYPEEKAAAPAEEAAALAEMQPEAVSSDDAVDAPFFAVAALPRRAQIRGWFRNLFGGRGHAPVETPAGDEAAAPRTETVDEFAAAIMDRPAEAEVPDEPAPAAPAPEPAEDLSEVPAFEADEPAPAASAPEPTEDLSEVPAFEADETAPAAPAPEPAEDLSEVPAFEADEPAPAAPVPEPAEDLPEEPAFEADELAPAAPVSEPAEDLSEEPAFEADEPASAAQASGEDESWSDDALYAAVDSLLERPMFAATDILNDAPASGDAPARGVDAKTETRGDDPGPASASRRELDALTVPELFDYFGLPRTEEKREQEPPTGEEPETPPSVPDQAEAPGENAADGDGALPAAPSRAEAPDDTAPESGHAPELWDPLALFSQPEDDGPPPLTPLSRDTTGRLPTLEEIFGSARESQPGTSQPAAAPVRREKNRTWLRKLREKVSALAERMTAGSGEQETGNHRAEDAAAEAADDRAPKAKTFEGPSDFFADILTGDPAGASAEKPAEVPVAVPAEAPVDEPADVLTKEPAEVPVAAPAEAPAEEPAGAATAEPAREQAEVPAGEPAEGPADAWDPLALFGGQAEDAELPTWEELIRGRRTAAAQTEAKTGEAPKPAEPEEESFGILPEAGTEKPEKPLPPLPELTLDPTLEEFLTAESKEPETVPMDLTVASEQIASAEPRQAAGEALTLADFLSAAVPKEEPSVSGPEPAPESARETSREQTLTFGAAGAQTISTAPENPAGLILTWSENDIDEPVPEADDLPPVIEEAADSSQKTVEDEEPEPAEEEGRTPFASTQAEIPGAQQMNAPFAEAPHVRPSENHTAEKAPVPSADVRPSAAADKRPRRREREETEALPPEEKVVLHPEEAYRIYARPLDAIGSRLILTGLFSILSLFFTLYLSQHWTFLPEIFSGGVTVFILLGLLGLMVLVNRKLYFAEWRDENGLRPALLLSIATAFAALDCISAAKTLRPPFTVVVGALLMVELWGRYDKGLGLITTVKVLRAEQLSAGVSEVQDITKGSRGLIRTKPDVERFMEKLETRDLTDRLMRIYTPVAGGLGLALTLLISLWLKRDFFWTGALVFLGLVPVTALLAFSRLFCLLASRLTEAQAALCGYHGAEVFGGEHSILIGDDDIFPAGSLTLNGFKVYNGNPDRMIAYAAAACRSSGSALDPIFEDLLVTHNGRHYTVDNFRFYDSGGIGASIQQDVVLMGSLDFMRRMGVHMDRGARVKQAVYMSLNGELAAVFAVRYNPPENLRRGLAAIAGNRHFKGILVTRTFLGTPGFLKVKFGIPTGAFAYPSTKERIRLSEAEMKRSGAQGAILAKDSFSGFAQAAAGGRLLRSATLGAAILTVLGGLTGLILMGTLAALGAYETATALNVLLYVAAWLAPTLLLTAWARHF